MRLIPILQIHKNELVKTKKFKPAKYVGDPVNAIRIFNLKNVDEIIVVDLDATISRKPNFPLLEKIAKQAFMPISYGGGISSISDAQRLLDIGFDKVIFSTALFQQPEMIMSLEKTIGKQSIIGSIDVKKCGLISPDFRAWIQGGRLKAKAMDICEILEYIDSLGVGEILIQNIDRDGTAQGIDSHLVDKTRNITKLPKIYAGGSSEWSSFESEVKKLSVSAIASGTSFTFYGPYYAVLQNYPDKKHIQFEHYNQLADFKFS